MTWERLMLAALTQGAGFIVRACFDAQPRQLDVAHWRERQTHVGRWIAQRCWDPTPRFSIMQIGDVGPEVEAEWRRVEDALVLGQ